MAPPILVSSGGLGLVYFYFSVAPLGAVSEPVPLIFTGSGSTSASGLDSGANAVFDILAACSMPARVLKGFAALSRHPFQAH